jgi:hypothetical protein
MNAHNIKKLFELKDKNAATIKSHHSQVYNNDFEKYIAQMKSGRDENDENVVCNNCTLKMNVESKLEPCDEDVQKMHYVEDLTSESINSNKSVRKGRKKAKILFKKKNLRPKKFFKLF